MKTRAVLMFEQYCKSEKTKVSYNFLIQKFVKHYNLDSYDAILEIDSKVLLQMVEDYVVLLKNAKKSSGYIRMHIFSIKSFCEANDKYDVNFRKVCKLVEKQKPKKTRPYTTAEIKRMLHSVKSLRNKALILFLSSSGVRVGALPLLKIGHLKQMPHGCVAVTVYESCNEEYTTFINKEANDYLTLYLEERKHNGEIITNDSPVFRLEFSSTTQKGKTMTEASVIQMLLRTKINAGVNFEGTPNLLCHAFRRRYNTIFKLREGSNPTLIERLMGHDLVKLDSSYFQPTLEQLFAEYQKGMADLTIDDSERLLVERKSIEVEKTKLDIEIQNNKQIQEQVNILAENQTKMNRIMTMIMNGDVTLVSKDNEKITLDLIKN